MISKYKLISDLDSYSDYVLPFNRSIVYGLSSNSDGFQCNVNAIGSMFIYNNETKEVAIENI